MIKDSMTRLEIPQKQPYSLFKPIEICGEQLRRLTIDTFDPRTIINSGDVDVFTRGLAS